MSGSALSISPIALLLAVVGYVLKRWWDNADSLMAARKSAYRQYYAAAYEMTYVAISPDSTDQQIEDVHAKFQLSTPEFYLCASPIAISISDVHCARWTEFRSKIPSMSTIEQRRILAAELNEALIVLREVLKSELYLTHPLFQLERFRARRRWQRLVADANNPKLPT